MSLAPGIGRMPTYPSISKPLYLFLVLFQVKVLAFSPAVPSSQLKWSTVRTANFLPGHNFNSPQICLVLTSRVRVYSSGPNQARERRMQYTYDDSCICQSYRNGAQESDNDLCGKREGGQMLCLNANSGDGQCPGDHIPCTSGKVISPASWSTKNGFSWCWE
mmetsp:Transcript_44925/g.88132  ORF Transcript_44925/g.88132 Transcript_44925/m.88132 type:complete len:162 (+) Transcript_44925:109-594(+)